MKLKRDVGESELRQVAPSRGRGLKRKFKDSDGNYLWGRPFTGAWIETFCCWIVPPKASGSPLHGGVD